MHGNGEFTWPVIILLKYIIFINIFKILQNGKKYVGSYVDDKKQGYGEFFWPGNNNNNKFFV